MRSESSCSKSNKALKRLVLLLIFCFFSAGLTACGKAPVSRSSSSQEQGTENTPISTPVPAKETPAPAASSGSKENRPEQTAGSSTPYEEETARDHGSTAENDSMKKLKMEINGTEVPVAWETNESVAALTKLVLEAPLSVKMSMYGGFEQVGSLGTSLPRNDVQTTTGAGDIVLYSGNQIVVFYGSNSWAYTRLGHVELPAAEMTGLLSHGDVTVTLSAEAFSGRLD